MQTHALKSFLLQKGHVSFSNKSVAYGSVPHSAARCTYTRSNTSSCSSSNSSSSCSNNSTSSDAADHNTNPKTAEVYPQLPSSFWDERRILYNRMRHERDRANRRARLKQLREAEEAQLAHMSPEARASYESEMTALRIAAAKQQKQVLADALQHGLKVVIDCSYCLPPSPPSSSLNTSGISASDSPCSAHNHYYNSNQLQQHQQHYRGRGGLHQSQHQPQQASSTQPHIDSQRGISAVVGAAAAAVEYAAVTHPARGAATGVDDASNGSNRNSSSSSSRIQEEPTSWQRGANRSSHEVRSLAKQIELSVSLNRRSSQPVALTVTSFTGNLETFALHMGAHSWALNKHAEHVLDILPAEHLVLLSPDADTPLLEVQPGKAYVIGGIVDRSVCKGLTAGFGAMHGLEVVRLPVLEYAEQLGLNFPGAKKRPVLNVSDVVVALIEFHRTGDWVHALEQALPARKRRSGATARHVGTQAEQNSALNSIC